ncbi:MAG: hypothetical protein VXY89_16355, partial [SAR324 cluster bacterium]|nr:hypothetical protein [SAR324 cluster bacterium]
FSENASAPTCHLSYEQLRMLSSIEQASEAIADGAKRLAHPEISKDVAERLFDSHKYWHQPHPRDCLGVAASCR